MQTSMQTEVQASMQTRIQAIEAFHRSITDGSLKKDDIIAHTNLYAPVGHIFNKYGRSAAATAIMKGRLNIYELLISNGICFGPQEDYNFIKEDSVLSETDKDNFIRKIRDRHVLHFKNPNLVHLNILTQQSRISFNSPNEETLNYQEHINRAFNFLNGIEEIEPILKLVSAAETLNIIFDFNRSSVDHMDPGTNVNTTGLIYPGTGLIYIGALNIQCDRKKYEVYGTLAHELCHYAMKLIYNNDCRPYHEMDSVNAVLFDEINKSCQLRIKKKYGPIQENAVSRVHVNYHSDVHHAELIVRVPQLLALFKDDKTKLQAYISDYDSLFRFFKEKVLVDCLRKHSMMEAQNEIGKLNIRCRVENKVKRFKLFLSPKSLELDIAAIIDSADGKMLRVSSNCPKLTLSSIVKLLSQKTFAVFAEFENFLGDDELFKSICATYGLNVKPFLIIDCESENGIKIAEIERKLADKGIEKRVILITNSATTSVDHTGTCIIAHQWHDLGEECQTKLMTKHIFMQGEKIPLTYILTADSPALNMLSIQDLIDGKVCVGDKIESAGFEEIFVKRMLREGESNEMVSSEALFSFATKKVILISEIPGMGKTTQFKMLSAEQKIRNPKNFVVFWKLKKFLGCYQNDSNITLNFDNINEIFDFLCQKVLHYDGFNAKVFKEMFDKGRVTFFVDGFDEITSCLKQQFVTNILSALDGLKKHDILISTRPDYEDNLKEKLNAVVYKLEPFSPKEKVEFCRKYLKSKNLENTMPTEAIIDKIIKGVNKVSRSWGYASSNPLLMQKVADLYCMDPTVEATEHDLKDVFRKFTEDRSKI